MLSQEEQKQARLERIDAELAALVCTHPKTYVRCKTTVSGGKMYAAQCSRCGDRVGDWIPHATGIKTTTGEWDDDLRSRYHDTKHELERALRERRNALQREDFFKDYQEYLKSPEWLAKRRAVLNRCDGTCEGCGLRPATQTHHLTYKNYRNEFLFELVGVCAECHRRLHDQGGER